MAGWTQAQSLVAELRSHMPSGVAKKLKKLEEEAIGQKKNLLDEMALWGCSCC